MSNGLGILGDAIAQGMARADERLAAQKAREDERQFARDQMASQQAFAVQQADKNREWQKQDMDRQEKLYEKRRLDEYVNGLVKKGYLSSSDINNTQAIAEAEKKFVEKEGVDAKRAFDQLTELKAKLEVLQANGYVSPEDEKLVKYVLTMKPDEAMKPGALEQAQLLVAKATATQGDTARTNRERTTQSHDNVAKIAKDGAAEIAALTTKQNEQIALATELSNPNSASFRKLMRDALAAERKVNPKAVEADVEGRVMMQAEKAAKTATALAARYNQAKEEVNHRTRMMVEAAGKGFVANYESPAGAAVVGEATAVEPPMSMEEAQKKFVEGLKGKSATPAPAKPGAGEVLEWGSKPVDQTIIQRHFGVVPPVEVTPVVQSSGASPAIMAGSVLDRPTTQLERREGIIDSLSGAYDSVKNFVTPSNWVNMGGPGGTVVFSPRNELLLEQLQSRIGRLEPGGPRATELGRQVQVLMRNPVTGL